MSTEKVNYMAKKSALAKRVPGGSKSLTDSISFGLYDLIGFDRAICTSSALSEAPYSAGGLFEHLLGEAKIFGRCYDISS